MKLKEGQVARSRELNTLLVMLASAVALWLLGGTAISGITTIMSEALSPTGDIVREPALLADHLIGVMTSAVMLIAPFLLLTVVAALAGPSVMGGLLFSPEAISFKLEKLDPVKGLGRVVSTKCLIELVKALLKIFLIIGVAVLVYKYFEREVMALTFDVVDGIVRSGSMICLLLSCFQQRLSLLQPSMCLTSCGVTTSRCG